LIEFDYIVIGSGATGAISAKALVDKGVNVTMLDVGVEDDKYKQKIPNKDFVSLRKNEKEQSSFFLGDDFEGVPWETSRVGSQLTPPRNFLTSLSEKILPVDSGAFQPLESLAKGGLGGGWGLGCYTFSEKELKVVGLDEQEMRQAYQAVISYIGVSGATNDDGSLYCLSDFDNVQKASIIGKNAEGILRSYKKQASKFNDKGFFMGRSGLALLTEDKDDRKATQYNDMGFWSDSNKSAYRSWMTIDELNKKPNFSYHKNCYVLRFKEFSNSISVYVKRIDTNEEQVFKCKKLILCPGVLGSARIVSRSFDYKKEKLPIICNPYSYIPCLQWRRLGKAIEDRTISFSQLILYLDENKDNMDVGLAALFSYRSLLLFKLIKETPLNFADARIIMQFLHSSFTIAGIHHPEYGSSSKYISINKKENSFTGDIMDATYKLSDKELSDNLNREKKIRWALGKLGCQPLKTIQTPMGGSIHYGGTLPFDNSGELFTVYRSGKLAGTKNVYIADGSGFKYLPAKGVTLTLMANAYRVALNSLTNE